MNGPFVSNSMHGFALREETCPCPLLGMHVEATFCEGTIMCLVKLTYQLTRKHLVLVPYYCFNELPDILALQISTCRLKI